MFQFPGFASHTYVFSMRYRLRGGFPHSDISGSKSICRLPGAFRRLPRPSSPLVAKASTICAYSLDYITQKHLDYTAENNLNLADLDLNFSLTKRTYPYCSMHSCISLYDIIP